jgi:hypothetical protein
MKPGPLELVDHLRDVLVCMEKSDYAIARARLDELKYLLESSGPQAAQGVSLWRVGSKVPLNVYEGDRPVCQCHNEWDAQRIVEAMNALNYIAGLNTYEELESAPGGGSPTEQLCAYAEYSINTARSVLVATTNDLIRKIDEDTSHYRADSFGPQAAQVVCPSCKEPLEESDDDKYSPYHVSCRFGGLDT